MALTFAVRLVYVVTGGKVYHTALCRATARSRAGDWMSISSARRDGLPPCRNCEHEHKRAATTVSQRGESA